MKCVLVLCDHILGTVQAQMALCSLHKANTELALLLAQCQPCWDVRALCTHGWLCAGAVQAQMALC